MKSFWLILKEYEKNGCANMGIEITPKYAAEKMPKCSNPFVDDFMAGVNVSAEEATTFGGFRYKASVRVGKYSKEDVANACNMLTECLDLFCEEKKAGYRLKPDLKLSNRDCEVIITMLPC